MKADPNSERFHGPSDVIDMSKLERETQKLLALGLLVAVSFHAALGSYFIFRKSEVKVARPPMVELTIRRPRMTKPFEFKKTRIKEREYVKKEMTSRPTNITIKPKDTSTVPVGTVAMYDLSTDIKIQTGELALPEGISLDMTATREPEKAISMKEEMISLEDLDTGQYKAMIIQDPQDKQSIKGFVYISTLWGAQLEPYLPRSVLQLSDAVNRWTNITSKVDKHLFIDSSRIYDSPFVFLSVNKQFELTTIEAANFGQYLRKGGFAVFDNGSPGEEFGAAEASLRKAFIDALGADAKFEPIPNNHPLFHCFFDFNDGPPIGSENTNISSGSTYQMNHRSTSAKQVLYIEGITIDNRLVAIYSDKGYVSKWEATSNNEPQLRMGVNMVVFALTQEGSISQQKMDFFSAVQ